MLAKVIVNFILSAAVVSELAFFVLGCKLTIEPSGMARQVERMFEVQMLLSLKKEMSCIVKKQEPSELYH